MEFPRDDAERSIVDLFEAQVHRRADRVAVRTPGETLTYAALNEAANQVAHALLEHEAVANGPVAFLFEADVPYVVASLGAMKAGVVQVPMDPHYPRPRLTYMLEQSGAQAVLARERDAAQAREIAGPGRLVLGFDAMRAHASREKPDPGRALGSDTHVGIEYTSGSTGHPKGIIRNHRGVVHDVLRHTNMSCLGAADRLVLPGRGVVNPLHALLNGAAYYPVARRPDALTRLAGWLISERVTVCRLAVSAFRTFAGSLTGVERFPDLRLIELYGEPVFERDVELYRKHFGEDCLLVSTLGTSEFGDFAHCFVDRRGRLPGGVVPAGYPAQGVEVLLLGEDGEPVAAGEAGEIAVRSRYGAAGYWRMPELTAAFFGHMADDGRRNYRTGDIGRVGDDGGLFHLGRRDFQVKINGNRVHVSEVEATLLDDEAVSAAAVVGQEVAPGSTRLVAYVVPAGPVAPTVTTLRQVVARRLPSYMVPAVFVVLDAFPRTATGKIDRRALPPPDGMRPALDTVYVAPRTPIEEALAALWAEVLHLDRVGVHDAFLDLGGDSLMATQVASRVLERFAMTRPPGTLLEAGTVAEMAQVVLVGLVAGAGDPELTAALDALESPPGPESRG